MSNILFITNSLNKGGASKRVMLIQKIIGVNKFHIFSSNISHELKGHVQNHNFLKSGFINFIPNIISILKYINKNDIDVIATNSRKYYFLCYLLCYFKSNITYKTVVQIVYGNVYPFQNKLHGSEILSVSAAVSSYLIDDVGISKHNISLIKNTVKPIPTIDKNSQIDIYNKIGIKDESIVFTCIARYDPVKGHEFMLECFANTIKKKKNLVLVLMGYGNLEDSINKKINNLYLQDYVVMIPSDFKISEILTITDISILLSKREGLSTFLLESMSVGLPIIASNIPGNDELVINNQNGYLVDFNVDEISKQIITLSDQQTLRNEMGENSRKIYDKYFSFENYKKNIKEFF